MSGPQSAARGQSAGALMLSVGNYPKRLAIGTSQFGHLRNLLAAVLGSNPFYTAKFDAAGANYKMRDLGQFTEYVPFTTKAEIVADQQANPPFGTNLTFPLDRYTRLHQTSGTSGTPIRWLDTPESWNWIVCASRGPRMFSRTAAARAPRICVKTNRRPVSRWGTPRALVMAPKTGARCAKGSSSIHCGAKR